MTGHAIVLETMSTAQVVLYIILLLLYNGIGSVRRGQGTRPPPARTIRKSRVRDNKIYYIGIQYIMCNMLLSCIILFSVWWRLRFSSDAVTHFFS